jgi:glycosidase
MALGLQSCTPEPSEDSVAKTDDVKEEQLNLHVESPDWRDQIIYFLMIDRFNDDNPANDDQVYNEYNPNRESHYSGGDIPGITAKLDYMQRLGATSIWLTPPVANQCWNNASSYSGYHGYWARDFKKVDEHYGTLEDYQRLSHELHQRNMYLIQDIVVNHTGIFFG